MGILIFLPEVQASRPEDLVEVGLVDLLDPLVTPLFRPSRGPKGEGTMVGFDHPGDMTPLDYNADGQTWLCAPQESEELPAGRFWVGYWNKSKPGPDQLRRERLIDGMPLRLLDDRQWIIPIAEFIPRRLTINPVTNEQESVPLPKHVSFVEQTNAMFKLLCSDQFQMEVEAALRVVIPHGLTYAASALSKNYRVTREVIDLLAIISEEDAVNIAAIATGLKALEFKKKGEAVRAG